MEKDIIMYIIIAAYSVGVIASVLTLNTYLVLASLMLFTIGILIYKGWEIMLPTILRRTGMIRLVGNFEIGGNQSVAVRKDGNSIIAAAYALIDISDSEGLNPGKLEGIISKVSVPFKLVLSVKRLNMDKILDSMETARHMKENMIARLSGGGNRNIPRINSLRRELEQIESNIRSMTSGKVPLQLLYYVGTEAKSESRYTAEEDALSGLKEALGAISSATGYQYKVLSGNDLVSLLATGSNAVM
ncbi:MAG: hypothetical protein QXW10_01750 [Candidatus Micrarchaeaceae archaeon]